MSKKQTEPVAKEQPKLPEAPKQVTLENATIEQLKVEAFDTDQQIKALQRKHQTLMTTLQNRMQKGVKNGNQ